MKNGLEPPLPSGFREMNPAELGRAGGGFARLFLGIPAAFRAIYDLGKAVGREMYYWRNN